MRKILVILGTVSLALLLWQCTLVVRHYYIGNDKLMNRIDEMQRLHIFSRTAVASYNNNEQGNHKTGDGYTFYVDGKAYTPKIEIPAPPQTVKFNVQYLPDDPNIQSVDPVAQLIMYRQQLARMQDEPVLTWILIFAGLCGLVYSVIKLIRG